MWNPPSIVDTSRTSISFGNNYPHIITAKRNLFIQTQDTPNPDSLKFLPGGPVLTSGTMYFPSFKEAQKSGLAKQLFKIEGVTGVFFGADFITVNKETHVPWHMLKPHVFGEIAEYFESGKPIVGETGASGANTEITEQDSEVVAMIKELLETRIRPAVQADGGDIVYRGFDSGVVLLQMQGSCSGCPSSTVTLKSGIERMLMHWIPEVVGVMAVSDDDLAKINLEAFSKVEKSLESKA